MNLSAHEVARIFASLAPAERSDWISQAVANSGRSASYWYTQAKRGGWTSGRRQRSDTGAIRSSLTEDQILKVARVKIDGTRANGKQITSTGYAAALVRGELLEFDPAAPSVSTLNRQLRARGLGPRSLKRVRRFETVNRATGEVRQYVSEPDCILTTDYPNQVHHVDTSICVIWRLGEKENYKMTSGSSDELIYRNKPDRMVKALKLGKRLIRYVLVDHCSAAIYFRYYEGGGENAADMFNFLYHAWMFKPWMPLHGAPEVLFSDAGSGLNNKLLQNALQRLDIQWKHGLPGNKDANGAAEAGQNVVELKFESLLRFQEVPSLEALNARAEEVCAWLNNVHKHSRLKAPRSAVWSMIPAEKLREIPDDWTVFQRLADLPAARKVSARGEISFEGRSFRTDNHALAGQDVTVFYNPYMYPAVDILHQPTGYRATLDPIPVNAFGRLVTGNNHATGTFDRRPDSLTVRNVKAALAREVDADGAALIAKMAGHAAARRFVGGAKRGETIDVPGGVAAVCFDNTVQAKRYLENQYGRPAPGVFTRVFELLPASGITLDQLTTAWNQVTAANPDQESHHVKHA